ncbi:MAG: hypothetical protein NTY22_09720, partial [Proteobacteria bacterium]|nr:hypothetical protein [Pseudomonadota bacterium]
NSDTINIKATGGKIGRETIDIPGFPVLSLNSEYLLFLQERGDSYDIYGANQGCMKRVNISSSEIVLSPCEKEYFNSIYVKQSSSGIITLDNFVNKIREYQKN